MSASKVTVSPKKVPVTKSNKPVKPIKPLYSKPNERVAQPTQSLIEISDLLATFPLTICWAHSQTSNIRPNRTFWASSLAGCA